jgi:hypothetical protein
MRRMFFDGNPNRQEVEDRLEHDNMSFNMLGGIQMFLMKR